MLAAVRPHHFSLRGTGAEEGKVLFLGYFPESVCVELVSPHGYEAAERRRCIRVISGDQVRPGEPQRSCRHGFFYPSHHFLSFGHSLMSICDPGGAYFHPAAECGHEWEDGKRRSLKGWSIKSGLFSLFNAPARRCTDAVTHDRVVGVGVLCLRPRFDCRGATKKKKR